MWFFRSKSKSQSTAVKTPDPVAPPVQPPRIGNNELAEQLVRAGERAAGANIPYGRRDAVVQAVLQQLAEHR